MSEEPKGTDGPPGELTGRQVYNVVSDTVTGLNARWSDNVVQGVAILAGLVLGVVIGALVASDRVTGMVFGGFAGLLVGLFGSGIALMIYRAVQHVRGRHD